MTNTKKKSYYKVFLRALDRKKLTRVPQTAQQECRRRRVKHEWKCDRK